MNIKLSPRLEEYRHELVLTWHRTVDGLFRHHAFDTAAAMAFYFFLSALPLLAFVGFLVGRVAIADGRAQVFAPLFAFLPSNVATITREELQRMGHAEAVAPFSLIGFAYLTSSGTHNLMDLLEVMTGAPPRGWVLQRGIALAWNAASVLVVLFAAYVFLVVHDDPLVVSAAQNATSTIERLLHVSIARADVFILFAIAFVVLVLAFALFFRIAVAHPPVIERRVFPGAIVAVVLGALVSMAFGAYVATLATYAVYYGSLAAITVVLLWLYLTSLAILVGAEINAQLEGLRPIPERLSRYTMKPPMPTSAPPPASTE